MPFGCLLEGVRHLQDAGIVARGAGDLQTDRQTGAGEAEGTEMVGSPSTLNGRVLRSRSSSRRRRSSGLACKSARTGATTGEVGVTSRS